MRIRHVDGADIASSSLPRDVARGNASELTGAQRKAERKLAARSSRRQRKHLRNVENCLAPKRTQPGGGSSGAVTTRRMEHPDHTAPRGYVPGVLRKRRDGWIAAVPGVKSL